MAADQGGAVQAPSISRGKVLEAIASLLAKKDSAYVEAVRKRARDNKLNLKGMQVSEEMVIEASEALKPQEPRQEPPLNGTAPVAAPAGQRWDPTPASVGALATKAFDECEDAEAYNERVRVIGGQKLAILPKPNCEILKESLNYLPPNEWTETCARVVNRKDGRVYVRLRHYSGWVSSRSRKDFTKVVLEVEEGKPPLEPPSTQIMSRSRVVRLVPPMTQEGQLMNEKDKSFIPKSFRTTNMAQILNHPDSQGAGGIKLNAKEEFLVDGAFMRPSDGRVYLHLKDGRGWICERTRADFFKLAVEPCGPAEDFIDDHEDALPSLKRTRDGGKKVIMLDKSEALGNDAEEPGAAESPAPDVASVFRSDAELWPEEVMRGSAIPKALRLKLRRLYLQHGARVKECSEDLKEVTDRVGTFGRSCPAQKELLQYAEALKKEADKAKKAWTDAVKALLKETPLPSETPSAVAAAKSATAPVPGSSSGSSCVSPVQVRGGRWYCAMLTSREEESGSGLTRQCGPLRMSHDEAAEDLKRLLQAKDEGLKRKSEAQATEVEEQAAPASKRGKTA